jgi:DNA-binding transcriptional LysR family regulator
MTDIDSNKIRQVDGTLLLVLQGLLRHRRTTVVADQLGLSQSAISHALGRLRRLFGDPLFVRRPHGLEPTWHALELAPHIDDLIAVTQAAIGLAANFDPATSTRGFRLGSSDFVATLLAPPLMAAFVRAAPQARFAFSLALGDVALRQLRLDEIDIALGRFANPGVGVSLTPLFTDDYVLVVRDGHPSVGLTMSPIEFEALEHVGVSVAGDFRTFTEADFAERGLARRIIATAPRFTIALGIVARSNAVCIAPRRLAQAYGRPFALRCVELPTPLAPIEVAVARRATPDPAIDWLLTLVQSAEADTNLSAPERAAAFDVAQS